MAQRGYPAIPLEQYTIEDCVREAKKTKPCAPYCTVFCVHRIAWVDQLRENPNQALVQLFPPDEKTGATTIPAPVRALQSLFSGSAGKPPSPTTVAFRKAAMRLLKIS
jgi:hypothetical protein